MLSASRLLALARPRSPSGLHLPASTVRADGWTDKPSPVPSWAPPTYRQCDMSKIGGATEEDFYCAVDMGLTQADTTKLAQEHDKTMNAVFDAGKSSILEVTSHQIHHHYL